MRYANCHFYSIFTLAFGWQCGVDVCISCRRAVVLHWDMIVYGDGHSAVRVPLVVTF